MAKTATMNATNRTALGSRANKRLRNTGLVPGVVYGHKQDVLPISLPKKELVNYLEHGAHVFSLAVGGQTETVLVKEVQYDHLGLEVLHVDFARVDLNERVQVTVPLELRGEPKGVTESDGVLTQLVSDLEIECVVTEIPEHIRHNVADMELDAVLHIKDIQLPPGVTALQDEDLIVATVKLVIEEAPETAAPEEGAAEPEVIGKKKEEEPAEGAAAPGAAPAAKK
ncbi:MAG TPA: 50S ribosomal protein L25 [Tepidisphaeraceae bacterium]|nr:50S ribosomal protein L25 [Tepidisphaeraceae bacterium]